MRAAHHVDAARVGHDQLGALAQPPLHPRGEDGVRVGRVGSDQQDHVGLVDGAEVLGAGGGAEGLLEAVSRRGVTHPRTGVDVVVAERRPDHLLDDVDLLVGAAAGGDAADRADAVLGLEGLEAVGRLGDRLVPRDLAPLVVDRVAHHRGELAVLVGGVAVGEPALDAAVALVGAAVLRRDHPYDARVVALALDLGAERAADAAVGAGGLDGARGHAELDDRLLLERGRRAGLHAGAARDALRRHEVGAAGADLRVEAASLDGEREGALDVGAGAHAAGADDAGGVVEREVRVAQVDGLRDVPRRRATRAGRTGPRRSRRWRPSPASRSCRGRSRRSPRGGRRGRAP